ncbi:MAG TPA: DNA topoisomerase IB [Candidatus Poseidoniales archaeon]|nr:MAG TPA: DNA topoisomerase IB [Candidatus Poseidoniales archaeon]HII78624.1 DNA topoisomerase IB [Poseidonia sp.]|tara:strand:+ start:245 stop:1420 length:1176 start_codon:yes stop_codon:yes gene_type:complete
MPVDADEALRRATLIRSDPSLRGISRRNAATEEGEIRWEYLAPDGEPVEEEDIIERWNKMGLPPAWEDVWICPNPRGHIQATGRDVKGRLQYRYHSDWTEITTEMKYDDVVYFASQLPRLRRQVARDLESGGMTLNTVAALVVRLIDLYNIRVGSDEYAKSNESYGLTTLKSMHVKHIKGDDAEGRHDAVFSFTGKSGKDWEITIKDDYLVDLILKTNRLGAKNADLFMYISDAGNEVDLKAEHINQYIRESSGMAFTAKNFRTWAATYRCAERLAFLATPKTSQEMKKWMRSIPKVESIKKLWSKGDWTPPASEAARNKAMLAVIDTVAADLGNTRTVCRSSYIHPWFLEAWAEGQLAGKWAEFEEMRAMGNMTGGESTALRILKAVIKS